MCRSTTSTPPPCCSSTSAGGSGGATSPSSRPTRARSSARAPSPSAWTPTSPSSTSGARARTRSPRCRSSARWTAGWRSSSTTWSTPRARSRRPRRRCGAPARRSCSPARPTRCSPATPSRASPSRASTSSSSPTPSRSGPRPRSSPSCASSPSRRSWARPSAARTRRLPSAHSSSEGRSRMEMVEVTIERRQGQGKGTARKLRRAGVIPAVFYGPRRTTVSIAVRTEEFERKLSHLEGSHLIRLVNDGGTDAELHDKAVLLREIQRHPVTGEVLHADFFEVDLTERLAVSVPLRFVGKAVGVVEGGVLQPIVREIQVECLPTEIPEFIEVDVSHLTIHQAVHLSELRLPERVTAMGEPTQPLVSVLPPTVEEAKPAAEAAEAVPAEGVPAEGAAAAPAAEPASAEGKGGGETKGSEGKGRKGGGEA